MTSKIVFLTLGLILTLSPCRGRSQANNNEAAIKRLESELEAALLKGDAVALERILADDYVEIDARGAMKKKSDVIAAAHAKSAAPHSVSVGPTRTVDDLKILFHGDGALVTGRTTISYPFMENQTSSSQAQLQNPVTADQERFMRSYAKINGHWQLVAWQTTFVGK
jgi:ketosteroid isomerase-like protein